MSHLICFAIGYAFYNAALADGVDTSRHWLNLAFMVAWALYITAHRTRTMHGDGQ